MDTRVVKKKLGLKDRYAAMTRGLGWETTYQPMDKVFPYDRYEGIRIHDWDQWQDPFRLTMDAYWKYQGEKEKKLYAVIEAFARVWKCRLKPKMAPELSALTGRWSTSTAKTVKM